VKINDRRRGNNVPANPHHPFPPNDGDQVTPALDLRLDVYYRENLGDGELGDPERSVYFGNYGTYQQRAPPGLIYHGDPIWEQNPRPGPVENGLTLDLFSLQQTLLEI